MARVLFLNLPVPGFVLSSLPLIRELVQRGHQIGYVCSNVHRSLIESAGALFIAYPNLPDAVNDAKNEHKLFKEVFLAAESVAEEYDLLVYDRWFFLGQSLAKQVNKPAVALSSMFAFSEAVARDMVINSNNLYLLKYRVVRKLITKFWQKNIKIKTEDFLQEISSVNPALNIAFCIKEFQIHNDDFDDSFHFVGPLISSSRSESNCVIPYHEMKDPIIYVSMGTLAKKKRYLKKCIQAFAGEHVNVIVSLGNQFKKEEFKKIPPNVYVYSFVPQIEVLQHASLFINHAGMNSVNESIAFGVPMLVSPVFIDQPLIAKRVVELRLGNKINLKKISRQKLKETAYEVMHNPEILENINQMKALTESAGGGNATRKSADLIEEYLAEIIRVKAIRLEV